MLHGSPRALCGIPAYPRQLTHAHALRDTRQSLSAHPQRPIMMQCLLPGFQHPGLSVKRICTFTPASTVCNVIPRTADICQYQKYTKEALGMLPFLYGLQWEAQEPPARIPQRVTDSSTRLRLAQNDSTMEKAFPIQTVVLSMVLRAATLK